MYAIIGEDKSDIATLKVLIRRLAKDNSVPIHGKGYDGCSQMLRKGAIQMRLFADSLKCKKFLVCYDADKEDPKVRYKAVSEQIVVPSKVAGTHCITIPIQEIEAWIFADLDAVAKVIENFEAPAIASPELVDDPKEELEKLSRGPNRRPKYSHATHNEKVAKYLDLEKVLKKCPSFRPLANFVVNDAANHL
jgi:hypothetical protein